MKEATTDERSCNGQKKIPTDATRKDGLNDGGWTATIVTKMTTKVVMTDDGDMMPPVVGQQ